MNCSSMPAQPRIRSVSPHRVEYMRQDRETSLDVNYTGARVMGVRFDVLAGMT